MFEHYVMFRLRPEKKGELQTFIARLKQLQADVPSVRSVYVAADQRHGPKAFDVFYHARFDDQAGFEAYMAHPRHIPVMKYVDEVCDAVADVDVEEKR